MPSFEPRDLIAIFCFGICAYLLLSGLDGEVKMMMGVVLGYYFHGFNDAVAARKYKSQELKVLHDLNRNRVVAKKTNNETQK